MSLQHNNQSFNCECFVLEQYAAYQLGRAHNCTARQTHHQMKLHPWTATPGFLIRIPTDLII